MRIGEQIFENQLSHAVFYQDYLFVLGFCDKDDAIIVFKKNGESREDLSKELLKQVLMNYLLTHYDRTELLKMLKNT